MRGGHKFRGDPKNEFDAALEALDSDGDAEEALAHIARLDVRPPPGLKTRRPWRARLNELDAAAAASTAVDAAMRRALAPEKMKTSKDWSSAAEALSRLVMERPSIEMGGLGWQELDWC